MQILNVPCRIVCHMYYRILAFSHLEISLWQDCYHVIALLSRFVLYVIPHICSGSERVNLTTSVGSYSTFIFISDVHVRSPRVPPADSHNKCNQLHNCTCTLRLFGYSSPYSTVDRHISKSTLWYSTAI